MNKSQVKSVFIYMYMLSMPNFAGKTIQLIELT